MANYSKTRHRMEIAIRLEAQALGLTDAQIADHIGITHSAYSNMKSTPEYNRLRSQILTGVLGDVDNDIKLQRQRLRDFAVPTALDTLISAALNYKGDAKLAVHAAGEILDREGSFAKVSRINIHEDEVVQIPDSDDTVANDLIAAVGKAKAASEFAELKKAPPSKIN